MMPYSGVAAAALAALVATTRVLADPIPLDAFVRTEALTDLTISPDGRYLAEIIQASDRRLVRIIDLSDTKLTARVV